MGVAYFIRYKNNEKIRPLLAKLAKKSGGYQNKIQRNEIHVFFDQGWIIVAKRWINLGFW